MGYTVEYLPAEAIMIVRIQGDFDGTMLHNMFDDTARYLDQVGGRVYRVTDCTALAMPLQEFIKLMRAAQDSAASVSGSDADTNVTAVWVGNDEWVSLYRDALSAQQHIGAPIHATLDDALMSLRLTNERHNNARDTQETPYIAPDGE